MDSNNKETIYCICKLKCVLGANYFHLYHLNKAYYWNLNQDRVNPIKMGI